MTSSASRPWWLALAAVSSVLVGCSSDTRPTAPLNSNPTAALSVAAQFQHLGDSVAAVGGDSDDVIRYYGAAAALRRIGVFDTITISVDSMPMQFDAVALAVDDTGGPALCPMPPMDNDGDAAYECPWGLFPRMTRTLFAWERDSLPHVVELVATSDSGAIGFPARAFPMAGDTDSTGAPIIPPRPARLTYYDGGRWWGTSGTQQNSVSPNGQPCVSPADTTTSDSSASADRMGHHWGRYQMMSAACQMASFTFSFDGTVSVPPVNWWRVNTANGTHELSVDSAQVPGAYITLGIKAPVSH